MNGIEAIKKCIIAKYPIVYIISWEEGRVERSLESLLQSLMSNHEFFVWSSSFGIKKKEDRIPETKDPSKAIEFVISYEKPAAFLFKDLHPFVLQRPEVLRGLRDAYQSLKNTSKFLFLISPFVILPNELKKEIEIIDFPLPAFSELEDLLNEVLLSHQKKGIPIKIR